MQDKAKGNRGVIVFIAILLLFVIFGAVAYLVSGNKGIEERFSQAVGQGGGGDEKGDNGFLGFNIEGNPLTYIVILILLIAACVVLLKVFKI
ncbi:MAG TPA: hypothetical protein VMC84_01165 [Methanocella sp.]|uniref:hypothetical protein n=1 Tax=Methanocella sp. TaxID=2052833 RepID=UPI002C3023B7|nr:hypothetical protein [Methanocella sp.]HTY89764.1 hypothetical protein [Methanocella sp.]